MNKERLTNYLQRKRPVAIDDICHHFLVDRGTASKYIKILSLKGKIAVQKRGKKHLYQEVSFSPTKQRYSSIVEPTLKSSSEV
jgi:predicted transcriptional regulator